MKKTILVGLILVFLGFVQTGFAFDIRAFKVNPNDQVMVTLLSMVINDLEMCRATMKATFVDNLLAIGHLNNAQSALKRTDLPAEYRSLVSEIHERIGKIKFYMVMNDLQNVSMRLSQLIGVVRAVIGAETGGTVIIPGGVSNPGTNLPLMPPEIPPSGINPGSPNPGNMPSGVHHVNN